MIWLSTVSLVAGGLLARHFKIIVLVPATFVIVVVAIFLSKAQTTDIWSVVLAVTVASVAIQVGYFLGMWIQNGLRNFFVRGSSLPSENKTARPPSIIRTPISR
jgi:membrane protein DedA with SNARE-associated domain